MATLVEIQDALADQVYDELCGTANAPIANLQADGLMVPSPSPPAIDIYQDETPREALGFGRGNLIYMLVVRARVTTADNEEGQRLLISMMDAAAETSVLQAITADRTLGGVVRRTEVTNQSAMGTWPATGLDGDLLGCTWTVRVIP